MHNAKFTTYRNEHIKKYNSKFLMKFDKSLNYFNLNLLVCKVNYNICDVTDPVITRHFLKTVMKKSRAWSSVMVKALRYKSEGPGIISRFLSLGIFFVVPPTEPCALRSTQPLKVSTREGVRAAGAYG